MRILLVSQHFPPDGVGGVERYIQSLAAELVKAGDTVSVVARRPTNAPRPRPVREQLPDGTTLHIIEGGGAPRGRFLMHQERLEQIFKSALIEAAPDVVHFNHLRYLSPRSVAIAHRLRVAVVISLHDFYFACPLIHLQTPAGELCEGPDGGRQCARTCFADDGGDGLLRWGLRTTYFRRLLALAGRVVCYSQYVASFFERFGVEPARVRVIPHGVGFEPAGPAPLARPSPQDLGVLNLAYCGTVIPLKGPHIILEALRVASLGCVNLAIIGQAPDREYIRRLEEQAAAVPGLALRFHGTYERDQLPHLLREVHCVVAPSLVPESGGIVPREALALGLPVLASRLGALPEVIEEGQNGFTFDPGRPGELAAILKRIVREEGLIHRLCEGVLRAPVMTVSKHAGAVQLVYREAMEDVLRAHGVRAADLEEIGFLHDALVGAGFDGAQSNPPVRPAIPWRQAAAPPAEGPEPKKLERVPSKPASTRNLE
jgi:glycosyltransferase involved in cell wall biosynthesis